MKYRLIGENNIFEEPIEQILRNRGITNVDGFLNPSEEDVIHYSKLKNIDKAVKCLLNHLGKNSEIVVIVDSDPDGFTSAALLINYIKKVFKKDIKYVLPKRKEHGIILKKVPNEVDLLIVPDAGSGDFKEHEKLKEAGIDCIILDHHEVKEESRNAIVVNSQLSPHYSNKMLSGVGIVYKFCKALDAELEIEHADTYLDLVSIGNIADMMQMDNLETRYYAFQGLKKIKNKLLKALFKEQEYSTNGEKTIGTVAFYIVPLINAAIRVGSQEEKDQLFRALLNSDEKIPYKKRGTDKVIMEHIAKNTARLLKNLKAKQDRQRDKGVVEIEKRIADKNLLANKVLIVVVTDILDKSLTGLVANQLSRKHERPIMLLRRNKTDKKKLSGSARGYERSGIEDFKSFLEQHGELIAQGHPNAFGVKVEVSNLIELNNKLNTVLTSLPAKEFELNVDFIQKEETLKPSFIAEIHDYRHCWGGGVDEPLIAFENFTFDKKDILILGKTKKTTLKFKHKSGVEFIMWKQSEDRYNELFSEDGNYTITLVGKCSVNDYRGNKTPQVIVKDFKVVDVEQELPF
ncbi:DHH family phosphoesterase [Shouchella clausii]|uniref:DHH family phosphoesterase n=1 Tax=Shouchella clausii TaxID=79880 RepID=UPI002DBFEE9F|nr:DHH family phosphoesterase [Shouchella clausii]MEB5480915.1 DHH family phosphoesterase [Shouchella clausii]